MVLVTHIRIHTDRHPQGTNPLPRAMKFRLTRLRQHHTIRTERRGCRRHRAYLVRRNHTLLPRLARHRSHTVLRITIRGFPVRPVLPVSRALLITYLPRGRQGHQAHHHHPSINILDLISSFLHPQPFNNLHHRLTAIPHQFLDTVNIITSRLKQLLPHTPIIPHQARAPQIITMVVETDSINMGMITMAAHRTAVPQTSPGTNISPSMSPMARMDISLRRTDTATIG